MCFDLFLCFLAESGSKGNTMSSVETASNGSGRNSSVPNQTPHNELEHMYLYNMPAGPRRSLCMILDQNDAWQDLAEHMGYTKMDIQVDDRIKVDSLIGDDRNCAWLGIGVSGAINSREYF